MNFKTKQKIEKIVFGLLTFIGFTCTGGCAGYFLGTIKKNMGDKMSEPFFLTMAILSVAVIYFLYYVNICLHETGHMIFGLLTGYKFNSLRFGKLMLVKENDKFRLCRYNMPGTGGQCIMTSPDVDVNKMPVVLYNLGGLIINLIMTLLGIALFMLLNDSHSVAGIIFLMFASTSLTLLISNGLPFSQIGTDGANAILLFKNVQARSAFKNQLEIVKYLANNISSREIPSELFYYDKADIMDNPLITAQAVNYSDYLRAKKMYSESKEMALYILENSKSINQLHEKILYGNILFITSVIENDINSAKEQFKKHKKDLLSVSGYISIQVVLYAYYTLVEPDKNNAEKYAKLFNNSSKKYPYPKEAEIEKEQFDMVMEVLKAQQDKQN